MIINHYSLFYFYPRPKVTFSPFDLTVDENIKNADDPICHQVSRQIADGTVSPGYRQKIGQQFL
jgi:hypothetical protein